MKKMMHPKHGWHIVYTPHEEAAMRLNGWVDDEPNAAPQMEKQPSSPPAPSVGAAPGTVDEARAVLAARGLPFDKRWGLARLLEALA